MDLANGTLTVHIIDAVQLPVVNHLGKQSPFVVIKLGATRKQSKANINGHRCPVWGERLEFVLDGRDTELQVEVFHESKFSGAAFIGRASLPLQQILAATQTISRRVRIGDAGEVRLHLAYSKVEGSRRASSIPAPGKDTMLGQAMDNATAGLENLQNAGRRASLLSSGNNLSRSQKKLGQQAEAPSWMYGPPPPKPQTAPSEPPATDLVSTSNGSVPKPQQSEGSKPASSSNDRVSTSPTRSFKKKIYYKLGLAGGKTKDASKTDLTANPESGSAVETASTPGEINLQPQLTAAPSSSRSSMLDSQEVPASGPISEQSNEPRQEDLIDLSDEHPSTSTAGLHSSGGAELPPVPTASRRGSATWMEQGLPMEPVEAVRYNLPDGGEAWLSKWEKQHERPRRATESAFEFTERSSSPWAQNRRQTDSFIGAPAARMEREMEAPLATQPQKERSQVERPMERLQLDKPARESSNDESTDSGSNPPGDGFFRGGYQVREWGERHGQAPSGRTFTSFADRQRPEPKWDAEVEHKWDAKASHERMRLRMQEMSSKLNHSYKEPFSKSKYQVGLGSRESSPPQGALMDTAMRSSSVAKPLESSFGSAAAGFGTATSAQELKGQGAQQGQQQAEPSEANTSDSYSISRERSGSAPVNASRPMNAKRYPQPQYNDSDAFSKHFADLDPCSSPPPFKSAFLHAKQQARQQPEPSETSQGDGQSHHGRNHSEAPATPRSRVEGEPEFGDTARIRQDSEAGPALESASQSQALEYEAEPQATANADPSSLKYPSPFGFDDSPFEEENLDEEAGDTVTLPSHARSRSGAARVPIKDIRQEMEADAPASVRVPRNSSTSEDSKPSLQALLSDSKQDWLIDEKDLEIAVDEKGKAIKLGSGAFGTVYKGVYDQSTEVAIKHLKYETQKDMDEALFEVAILKKQLHPNILQFLGASIGEGSIQLVTELMAGNLYKALRNGKCTWYRGGKSISKNIASALAYLHKKKVVHLDVKSANILLTTNNVAKLGDLGLSAMVNTDSFVNTLKGLGTLQWASPEVLLGTHPVTSASDVYSFGTVLWEICTGQIPQKPLRRINDKAHPNEGPREVELLIERCLSNEPSGRPTMQEAYLALKDL